MAALYEQGRVHHLGAFPQFEDQMCGFVSAGYGDFDLRSAGHSPERVDALVWALTDLLVEPMSNQRIYEATIRGSAPFPVPFPPPRAREPPDGRPSGQAFRGQGGGWVGEGQVFWKETID